MSGNVAGEIIMGVLYSKEPKRFNLLNNRQAIVKGNHQNHILLSIDGVWQCDCEAWERRASAELYPWCRHTMALQRILTAINDGTALVCRGELVQSF